MVENHVSPDAVVHADEASHWDALLHAGFDTRRINHGEAYSSDLACTSMAESYFSRLRRAEIGTHRNIAGLMPMKWRGAKIIAAPPMATSSAPSLAGR